MRSLKATVCYGFIFLVVIFINSLAVHSFQAPMIPTQPRKHTSTLSMSYYSSSSSRSSGAERSKRQERVGRLVGTELSQIIHSGNIKGRDVDYLDSDVRQCISVVHVNVSPDLRQARVTVSIRGDDAVDKRRAYSWLVRSSKPIRHTLAQRLSHMKTIPNLSFAQADVSAAVDVMYLIDKVASGYKRESVDVPEGMVKGIDFDKVDDDDEWEFDEEGLFES